MSIASRPARRLASLALVMALPVGAIACGSNSDGEPESGTDIGDAVTLDASSTTTTAPPTTVRTAAPPTTAAPTTVAEPVGVPEAAAAATKLYDAWVAGDRATAATIADPAAVEGIFAAVPGPYELYRDCDTGEFDTGGCLFRDRSTNNTIQVDLEKRESGWVVSGTFFSPG